LIAAGTSFSTAGLAAEVDGFVLGVEPEVELEELLLLPHAAIATTDSSETGTASQVLDGRIYIPFPEEGRQHKREIALRATF
jgi:hypothetical protein